MPFGRHGDLMKMWNGKKHGDVMSEKHGNLEFAYVCFVLLTLGTFCSLLARFAHSWNVLLTLGTFCSLLDIFVNDRQARRPFFFVSQYCRVRARQTRDK
jgi:hypothetical protein